MAGHAPALSPLIHAAELLRFGNMQNSHPIDFGDQCQVFSKRCATNTLPLM